MNDTRPIGIFDSGMGGLTVLRAIRAALPRENLLYLGDTARLPYGTKSARTVKAYAMQAVHHLMRHDVKMIVIACNTASGVALPSLEAALAPLAVIGVVEPGVEAALATTQNNHVAVLATESTVRGGAYEKALRLRNHKITVTQKPCPLFVPLAEEGWTDGPVATETARLYLAPLFGNAENHPDTLLLGCTHFPVFRPLLDTLLKGAATLVDSAQTTATAVAQALEKRQGTLSEGPPGTLRLLATDSPDRFARTGTLFLDEPLEAGQIELVDL